MSYATEKNINQTDLGTINIVTKTMALEGGLLIPSEAIMGYANSVAKEKYEHLKRECEEKDKYISKLEKSLCKKTIECDEKNEEIERLRKQKGGASDFCGLYNPLAFTDKHGNMPTCIWIRNLWDIIYNLCFKKTPDDNYYIENQTSATIIYKILKESNRIEYQFNSSFKEFCFAWNTNIVARIKDPDRTSCITCKEGTVRKEYNEVWKSIALGKLDDGSFSGEHARVYSKARNIIIAIMPQIMAISQS